MERPGAQLRFRHWAWVDNAPTVVQPFAPFSMGACLTRMRGNAGQHRKGRPALCWLLSLSLDPSDVGL